MSKDVRVFRGTPVCQHGARDHGGERRVGNTVLHRISRGIDVECAGRTGVGHRITRQEEGNLVAAGHDSPHERAGLGAVILGHVVDRKRGLRL